jgi:predicted DNA-binding protein (MmcQ/YjbR family)
VVHSNSLDSPAGRRLLKALRKACGQLPEVNEEVDGFGHTTFRVRKKSFVIAGMGESGVAVSIKSDPTNQGLLVDRGPWYRTPYIGQHGWVTVDDPLEQDWPEIAELIVDGYRLAAPARLAKLVSR